MSAFDVDLFVIGAGSGGTRAARIAAGHGASVAIAEEDRIGGTCVIRGCVPKKLFVYASRFADEFEDAAGFGWKLGKPEFDWPTLRDAVANEVGRLSGLYRKGLEAALVQIHEERAVIEGAHTVRLQRSGKPVRARHILV
ncbi:MAG: FAD-dependent oxidoreductase, partial [Bosea sp.]|nr:FAD-dependent oxidoreductase [Bosea sp. (in: a-proteobacteria)]